MNPFVRARAAPQSSPISQMGAPFLYAFLFIAYARVADYAAPTLHLPLIAGATALLFAIASGGLQRALSSWVGLLFAALTAWLVLGIPLSFWKGGSFNLVFQVWARSMMVFVTIVGLLQTLKQVRRAMYSIALAVLAITLMALYFGALSRGRLALPAGMLENPNDLAQILLIGLPFWLLMSMEKSRFPFRRTLCTLWIIPTLIIIVHTGSRTALIALAVLGLVVFRNVSFANKIKLAIAGVVLASVSLVVLPESVTQRYVVMLGGAEDTYDESEYRAIQSSQQRFMLLRESIKITMLHPLLGVGPGQFQAYSARYAQEQGRRAAWRETHNSYTQLSSEAGLPALFLYAAVLVYCIRKTSSIYKATRSRRELNDISMMSYVLLLALVSFAVTAMASSIAYRMFLPTLAGLTVAFVRAAEPEIAARRFAASQPVSAPPMPKASRPLFGRAPVRP